MEGVPATTVEARFTVKEVPATMVEAPEEEENHPQSVPLENKQPPPEERRDFAGKTSIVKTVKAQSIGQPSKLVTSPL